MTRQHETVPGVPGLYVRRGKRKNSYSARVVGKYVALGNDETRAKAKLRELLELPPDDNTIRGMCETFIAEQWELWKDRDPVALAERTIRDYEECLRKYIIPVFGNMAPAAFKPTHMAQYLERNRKLKRAVRANRDKSALSAAFNSGMRRGLVDLNPCHGVKRNKERPRQRSVSIAELNAFLAHARLRGGSQYLVALIGCCVAICGRRRAEILSLPKSAATADGIRTKDAKTKPGEAERAYLVEWSPILHQLIAEVNSIPRRVASIYLFPTLDGQPYTDSGFSCLWQRLMRSYAVKASNPLWFAPHDLRALYVSEMIGQGRDPNTHKNPETERRVYDRRREIKVKPLA